jgi:hypothetical protein
MIKLFLHPKRPIKLLQILCEIAIGYGLDDRKFGVRVAVGSRIGVHPAFYPMGTRGSFPGYKAAVA